MMVATGPDPKAGSVPKRASSHGRSRPSTLAIVLRPGSKVDHRLHDGPLTAFLECLPAGARPHGAPGQGLKQRQCGDEPKRAPIGCDHRNCRYAMLAG
jgi:hypothetical protein